MSAQTQACMFAARRSTRRSVVSPLALLALACVCGFPALLFAQSPAQSDVSSSQPAAESADASSQSSTLPPAPTPQQNQSAAQPPDRQNQQTSRILGIIPNFRAVSTDQHLPPQSVKEKFVTATQDSFDYSSLAIPVAVAGYNYLRNSTPEFGTGGVAYGRYLWHVAVDQTTENYMVEFFVPAATHEDTRFYTLGHGGFLKRSGYALSRVVVTRSDAGTPTFNVAEVIGAGISAGISTTYYPTRERSFANTGSQWGLNVAIDAMAFVVKEFWPDINHRLFHDNKSSSTPASSPSMH